MSMKSSRGVEKKSSIDLNRENHIQSDLISSYVGLGVTIPEVSALQLTWLGLFLEMTTRWCYYHYYLSQDTLSWGRLIRTGCVSWLISRWSLGSQDSISSFQPQPDCSFQWHWQALSLPSYGPLTPTSLRSLAMELATKPLQPTSIWHTFTFQPRFSASAAKLADHSLFHSYASSTASSQGTVSSMMKTRQQELDRRSRSGHSLVVAILDGKTSLWPTSTHISQSLGCVKWA